MSVELERAWNWSEIESRSGGVAWIEIVRRLLLPLRYHPGGVPSARHSPRAELFTLLIVFGLARPAIVDLPTNPHALVMDMAAGLRLLPGKFAFARNHRTSLCNLRAAQCNPSAFSSWRLVIFERPSIPRRLALA
jgi:hypothetical protein